MAHIHDVKIGNNSYLIEPTLYGAATTNDNGANYTVSLTNFELNKATGVAVQVKFPSTNAASTKLNVNSTGAKAIFYNGAAITADTLKANHTYTLVYDGTQWQLVGDIDTNTQRGYGTSATAVSTTAAAGSAATVSRSDHVHSISLATGDSSGQIKIAGVNVTVKDISDLAYIAKGSGSTKFLREDGTWQTALTSHQTYTAFTGKPTANQTPDFGDTFTIQQISQSISGQISGADKTVTIPNTSAGADTAGLVDTNAQTFSGVKTFNNGIHIYGNIDMAGTAAGKMQSGGAYHASHNTVVLHGDSAGISGIGFTSQKATNSSTITNINSGTDRAFIQYHAYGVTPAAEGTAPTPATSGEAGRFVIGVGNDSGDKILLQAPGDTDILHQKGATGYPIPHTTNTNGSVGGTTTPVYVEAGVIKAGTALGASAYHADSYFALASHGTHVTTESVKTALGVVSTTAKKFLKDTGDWVQVDWEDLTSKPSTFTPSSHTHYELATIGDKRSENTTPNTYANRLIFQGLKYNSTIGNPYTDTYSYLVGLRGWSDSSGGNSHELAFNGNGIYRRQGATTTWGNWFHILDSNNTYAANSNGTAVSVSRNADTTIATINGVAVKIKIPASDNTWRPIGTGATDAMAGNTIVTNVSYTAATDNASYPILLKNSTGSTTTAAGVKFNTGVTINPSESSITATEFIGNIKANNIIPILTKEYSAYTCLADDGSKGVIFFGKVAITNSSPWQTPWAIHYRIYVSTSEANTQGWYDCYFSISGSTVLYYNYNNFYSSDYRPIYHHRLLYPKSGYSSYGGYFGVRIQSSRSVTTLARTIKVEVIETKNCTVELLDSIKRFDEIYVTTNNVAAGTIWYNIDYNGTSAGLQESGDTNSNDTGYYILSNGFRMIAGANKVSRYTLFARIADGSYESFTITSNNTGTSKAKNPHGYLPDGKIYWNSNNADYSGATSASIYEQYHSIDYRYTFNISTNSIPANAQTYVVFTYNTSDGLLYLDDIWFTTTPNETGKIYQRIGNNYYGSADYRGSLLLHNPYYIYDGTDLAVWYPYAEKTSSANLTSTTNAIAYYSDTIGTFASKASANGALYATSANGALSWGTLPVAQGGTGQTSIANIQAGKDSDGNAINTTYVKKVTSTDNAIVRFDDTSGAVQNSTATINDNGTMTINGRLIINPKKDTSGQSYNEGIRINQSTNGWANIQFGGADESTSGTTDGQWLAGRRGAAGSKVGAIGDFSIEEQNSIGGGLTLHKDNGGITLYSKLAYGKSQLKIWNDSSIAAGKYGYAINAVSAMAATANSIISVGAANSSKNQAYLGFHYEASGSDNNYLTLGLYDADHLLKIFPTGQVSITKDTDSSSTSTGCLITAGGAGIAKKLYVGTGIYITSTSADNHLSFARTGGHSSPNYINVPASSSLAISVGGYGGNQIVAMIDPEGIVPYITNTKSIGTSTYKWNAVYATTFNGALNGNATTATQIKVTLATAVKTYLVGVQTAPTANDQKLSLTGDTGVYLTSTAGQLSAKSYYINDGTNEKIRMEWNSTDQSLDFVFA